MMGCAGGRGEGERRGESERGKDGRPFVSDAQGTNSLLNMNVVVDMNPRTCSMAM